MRRIMPLQVVAVCLMVALTVLILLGILKQILLLLQARMVELGTKTASETNQDLLTPLMLEYVTTTYTVTVPTPSTTSTGTTSTGTTTAIYLTTTHTVTVPTPSTTSTGTTSTGTTTAIYLTPTPDVTLSTTTSAKIPSATTESTKPALFSLSTVTTNSTSFSSQLTTGSTTHVTYTAFPRAAHHLNLTTIAPVTRSFMVSLTSLPSLTNADSTMIPNTILTSAEPSTTTTPDLAPSASPVDVGTYSSPVASTVGTVPISVAPEIKHYETLQLLVTGLVAAVIIAFLAWAFVKITGTDFAAYCRDVLYDSIHVLRGTRPARRPRARVNHVIRLGTVRRCSTGRVTRTVQLLDANLNPYVPPPCCPPPYAPTHQHQHHHRPSSCPRHDEEHNSRP